MLRGGALRGRESIVLTWCTLLCVCDKPRSQSRRNICVVDVSCCSVPHEEQILLPSSLITTNSRCFFFLMCFSVYFFPRRQRGKHGFCARASEGALGGGGFRTLLQLCSYRLYFAEYRTSTTLVNWTIYSFISELTVLPSAILKAIL